MTTFRTVLRIAVVLAFGLIVGLACRQELPPEPVRSLMVYPTEIKGEPEIRVLVADELARADLVVSGAYTLEVVDPDGSQRTGGGDYAVKVAVRPAPGGLHVGQDKVLQATIRPAKDRLVGLRFTDADGQARSVDYPYPLTLLPTTRTQDGESQPAVRAVVHPRIETYLVGVVSHEMYPTWPLEALRAQAVASRTVALYWMKQRKGWEWDVRSTTSDQVWKPLARPNPRVVTAVRSTQGIVMLDDNRLFPAFFHAQCGGRTTNAKGVLLKKDLKALWGVRCPFCWHHAKQLKHWRLRLSKTALAERLGLPGALDALRLLDRKGRELQGMGRVHRVELLLKAGTRVDLPANESFRHALGPGPKSLASTWFGVRTSPDGTSFLFEGRGAGHGVGLCQYGAMHMAKEQGMTYQDILARFYTGTRLVRVWGE